MARFVGVLAAAAERFQAGWVGAHCEDLVVWVLPAVGLWGVVCGVEAARGLSTC